MDSLDKENLKRLINKLIAGAVFIVGLGSIYTPRYIQDHYKIGPFRDGGTVFLLEKGHLDQGYFYLNEANRLLTAENYSPKSFKQTIEIKNDLLRAKSHFEKYLGEFSLLEGLVYNSKEYSYHKIRIEKEIESLNILIEIFEEREKLLSQLNSL
ncbi:hypothetical protein J4467_00815 [Candidatus Woesearchaeota archaeon]|nr:hypothetical protein [Candidatus Woesearchaeota archaeon]